ncbi:MAG: tetratricopeptide repeat protein [Chloroflexi bacterium]|nr:tetratricopeptide repeat protein [Chloroflexota bacterium]
MVEAVSRYRSWLGWALVALAGLALIVVNPAGYDAQVLPKVMLIRLAVVAMAGLWVLGSVFEGGFRIRRTPLDLPVLALVVVWALSAVFGLDHHIGFYGDIQSYDGFLTLLVFAGLFYLATGILNGKTTERLALVLVASSALLSVYGILQHFKIDFLATGSNGPGSTFGNPHVYGAYLAFVLPFAVATFLSARSPKISVLLAADVLLVAAALALLLFKGDVLAALVGIVALAVGSRTLVWERRGKAVVAVGLIVAGLVTALVAGGFSDAKRATRSLGGDAKSYAATWRYGAKLSLDRPVLGSGPDNVKAAYFTGESLARGKQTAGLLGNIPGLIQIAITTGVLGLLALLVFIVSLLVAGYRASRNSLLYGAYWSGVIGLGVAWLFFGGLSSGLAILAWLSFSVLGAAVSRKEWNPEFPWLKKIPPAVPTIVVVAIVLVTGLSLSKPVMADVAVKSSIQNGADTINLAPETDLKRAIDLNPGEASYLLALAKVKATLAESSSDIDELREAEALIDQAMKMDAADPNLYLQKGRIFASRLGENPERLQKASGMFSRAIALDPDLSEARYELGMTYASQKKLDKAISVWNDALKRDPKLSAVWYALGAAYEQKKDLTLAKKNYEKAFLVSNDQTVRAQVIAKLAELKGTMKTEPVSQ